MQKQRTYRIATRLIGLFALANCVQTGTALNLDEAITLALARDTGTMEYQHHARAAREDGNTLSRLPDPMIMLAANNIPTDSFDLNQEPMTMLEVGLSQRFPAGDSRSLQREIGQLRSATFDQRAAARQLEIVRETRKSWYRVRYWQQVMDKYVSDRKLFEQLLDITRSQFTVGRAKQQDVLWAELEITRLDERVMSASNTQREAQAVLARWVGEQIWEETLATDSSDLAPPAVDHSDANALAHALSAHPKLQAARLDVDQEQKATALAQQEFKPSWELDMSYALRDGEDVDGSKRSNFASVMVSFTLPVFNRSRQESLIAARQETAAGRHARYTDRLRELTMRYRVAHASWQQMAQRRELFESRLLSQSQAQAEATLNAYRSDATDFSEVMRAFLSDQQTQIDYQELRMNELSVLADLHFLAATEPEPTFSESRVHP